MDHKHFFEIHGHHLVTTSRIGSLYSAEELYQAFKQRLIEEVSTEGKKVDGQYTFFRLIDTTDQEASRG